MVANLYEVLDAGQQGGYHVRFHDLAGLFANDHFAHDMSKGGDSLCKTGRCDANDIRLLEDSPVSVIVYCGQ